MNETLKQTRTSVMPQTADDGEILNQSIAATEQAIDKREAALLEIQLAASSKRPRSVKRFLDYATELATIDEQTAAECSYSVPRGGKKIEGASIRLAEICALAWGNLHSEVHVSEIGDKFVNAAASCWDLETNNRVTEEQPRSIMTSAKKGPPRRFDDDMIIVTMKAAMSIALRNAIFRIIPGALVSTIRAKCIAVVRGDEKTLSARRSALVAYFVGKGISEARICAAVEKGGIDDIGIDDLVTLKGYATAIKVGEAKIEDCFPPTDSDSKNLKPKGESLKKPEPPKAEQADLPAEPPAKSTTEQHDEIEILCAKKGRAIRTTINTLGIQHGTGKGKTLVELSASEAKAVIDHLNGLADARDAGEEG